MKTTNVRQGYKFGYRPHMEPDIADWLINRRPQNKLELENTTQVAESLHCIYIWFKISTCTLGHVSPTSMCCTYAFKCVPKSRLNKGETMPLSATQIISTERSQTYREHIAVR
jgi:hypothetical protein